MIGSNKIAFKINQKVNSDKKEMQTICISFLSFQQANYSVKKNPAVISK